MIKGRPPSRDKALENCLIGLFVDNGEEAFRRALDGYFSCLNGSDDFPNRRGYDLATFIRQFDHWESGAQARASPRRGAPHQPSTPEEASAQTLAWITPPRRDPPD